MTEKATVKKIVNPTVKSTPTVKPIMINMKVNKLDDFGNIIKTYDSMTEAAKENKTNTSNIRSVCKGNRNKAGGYRWSLSIDQKISKRGRPKKKRTPFSYDGKVLLNENNLSEKNKDVPSNEDKWNKKPICVKWDNTPQSKKSNQVESKDVNIKNVICNVKFDFIENIIFTLRALLFVNVIFVIIIIFFIIKYIF